jgi:hypothetical protein
VAASTQNQALSAILFLYGKVMEIELPSIWQFEGRCELALVKRPKALSEKTYGFSGHLWCPFYYSF